MEIIYDNQLVYNTSNQVEFNKDIITRFVACQIIETYSTREMDFINISYNQRNIEVGYFIASVHDIIKHDNPTKTYLYLSTPYAFNQDMYISNKECRENSYKYCFKEGDIYFYSNDEIKPHKQLISLIEKLYTINKNIAILITSGNMNLFLLKPNTYLMLGHKSYRFWTSAKSYLNDNVDQDANELKEMIQIISCNL